MGVARMYSKGQITIPKAVREAADLHPGDPVVVEPRGDEVVVRRPRGVLEFKPPPNKGTPLPWPEARRVAWDEHIREKYGRR